MQKDCHPTSPLCSGGVSEVPPDKEMDVEIVLPAIFRIENGTFEVQLPPGNSLMSNILMFAENLKWLNKSHPTPPIREGEIKEIAKAAWNHSTRNQNPDNLKNDNFEDWMYMWGRSMISELTTPSPQPKGSSVPNLSDLDKTNKDEFIKEFVEMTAKNVLSVFVALGLKTHLEATVVNDADGNTYKLSFRNTTPPEREDQIKQTPEDYDDPNGALKDAMDKINQGAEICEGEIRTSVENLYDKYKNRRLALIDALTYYINVRLRAKWTTGKSHPQELGGDLKRSSRGNVYVDQNASHGGVGSGDNVGGGECPNCKETVEECACMRNICRECGQPVDNITFIICDDCWDKDLPTNPQREREGGGD